MDTLHTVREWVPAASRAASAAVADRASDVLDIDFGDVVGDVAELAADLAETAGEGLAAAVAATEVASRATVRFARRHPWLVVAALGALVAGIVWTRVRARRSDEPVRALDLAA